MGRRDARKNAFYLLFQVGFSDESELEDIEKIYFDENEDIDENDKTFIKSAVYGVIENKADIDEKIKNASKGWTIDRMSKVDLAILRLAIYEMLYNEDVPRGVAINEAVELAKKYSSDEAPSFINGILASIDKISA